MQKNNQCELLRSFTTISMSYLFLFISYSIVVYLKSGLDYRNPFFSRNSSIILATCFLKSLPMDW
jgi:hypothetical protein